MKSLFDLEECKKVIERIKKLSSESKAEWGKMNAAQAFAHMEVPLLIALGDVKLKRSLIGKILGGIAKKKILKEESFQKNLPTDKKFIMSTDKNFDEEKIKLIKAIERFNAAGPDGIVKDPHPFFGELTTQEWDLLMYKHVDHHLRQFGV